MTSEQAIKDRAKQIDPCAFQSYSGSARRDAQNSALEQARRELEGESRGPRRYSIDEIDRMRKAISRVQPWNYMNRDLKPSVEDQLRTAMLGGVTAQELEDKAALYWEAIRQRREAKQALIREQEARDAHVRFAGRAVSPSVMAQAEAIVADAPIGPCWKQTILVRIETLLHRLGVGR